MIYIQELIYIIGNITKIQIYLKYDTSIIELQVI